MIDFRETFETWPQVIHDLEAEAQERLQALSVAGDVYEDLENPQSACAFAYRFYQALGGCLAIMNHLIEHYHREGGEHEACGIVDFAYLMVAQFEETIPKLPDRGEGLPDDLAERIQSELLRAMGETDV